MRHKRMAAGIDSEIQGHPYPPCVPDTARALILGSAPPWRFCAAEPKPLRERDLDFYYGSSDHGGNLLWEVLFRVFEPASVPELESLRALDLPRIQRTLAQRDFLGSFLQRHRLAVADILLRFERRERKAADAFLHPLEFLPLLQLLREHPSLGQVFCTSRGGVYRWLERYLAGEGVVLSPDPECDTYSFILPDAESPGIRVRILPSPSPVGRLRFPDQAEFVHFLTQSYSRMLNCAD